LFSWDGCWWVFFPLLLLHLELFLRLLLVCEAAKTAKPTESVVMGEAHAPSLIPLIPSEHKQASKKKKK
jgi:hypothetical protein